MPKHRASKEELRQTQKWLDQGRRLQHVLLLIFRLRPGQRVEVGMAGDTARLAQLEHTDPGIWRGVEAALLGRRYVQSERSVPEDDGPNPVRLTEFGYRILRMDGYKSGNALHDEMFRRQLPKGKVWYEKGEKLGESQSRVEREQRERLPRFNPERKHPTHTLTAHQMRVQALGFIFRQVQPEGKALDPDRGPTEVQVAQMLNHKALRGLLIKGLLYKQSGQFKLTKAGIKALLQAGIRVQQRKKKQTLG